MTVRFTPDHEWIDAANAEAAPVGITPHAQEALGDVVFVELPEVAGRSAAVRGYGEHRSGEIGPRSRLPPIFHRW